MKCKVCGNEIKGKYSQCRKCGTILERVGIWHRINVFQRIADLELLNKKQVAVIMKLWKMVEKQDEQFI